MDHGLWPCGCIPYQSGHRVCSGTQCRFNPENPDHPLPLLLQRIFVDFCSLPRSNALKRQAACTSELTCKIISAEKNAEKLIMKILRAGTMGPNSVAKQNPFRSTPVKACDGCSLSYQQVGRGISQGRNRCTNSSPSDESHPQDVAAATARWTTNHSIILPTRMSQTTWHTQSFMSLLNDTH